LRTADERVQERKSVGDRKYTVLRYAQPPCLPVYAVVVGDKVMNCIGNKSSKKEVIGPIVALRIHCAKYAFNVFDARWIGQRLVLGKQYLTSEPAVRVSVCCELAECFRVDQEMEVKLCSALYYLHCKWSVSFHTRWTGWFQGDQDVGVEEKPLHRFGAAPPSKATALSGNSSMCLSP